MMIETAYQPRSEQTPEVVGKLITLALADLSSENGHHDFEHLCRHIARRRIASNIIPATGPVSAGGDRGADFETLPVLSPGTGTGYWEFSAGERKILFACSLESNLKRKVRDDVDKAAAYGQPIHRLYFFYNRPVPIGTRNSLKDLARNKGIELEIIDAKAIAEFLAHPEMVWIAEHFLKLPSEIILLKGQSAPKWYSQTVAEAGDEPTINADMFYRIKQVLRYATHRAENHSDIPRLILGIRRFRSHLDPVISRKAFYEEFVAALRGLEEVTGYESQVLDYLSAIPTLAQASELEDAAILLCYANTACSRNLLTIPHSTRLELREAVLVRVDALLQDREPSLTSCALLFIKGYLLLQSWAFQETQDAHTVEDATSEAVRVWSLLLEHSQDIPMFPIERLSPIANFYVTLVQTQDFSTFLEQLDRALAKRSGQSAVAEQHLARASALLEAKQHLRSLEEFHAAHRLAHSSDDHRLPIVVCLQLAAIYHHLGLYFAAKYYALAASFAALRLSDEDVKDLIAVGFANAVQADYAVGASLLYFMTFTAFHYAAHEFDIAGREEFRRDQWSVLDFYALILTRAAALVSQDLYTYLLDANRRLGLDEAYETYSSELDHRFNEMDFPTMKQRYEDEGISAPFADARPLRRTAWSQLGINWEFVWEGGYDGDMNGEAAVAVFQIILAAHAKTEFSIIATNAKVVLQLNGSGRIKVIQTPNNKTLEFKVQVDPTQGMQPENAVAATYSILSACSAIDADVFHAQFRQDFERGLPERISIYISGVDVFKQVYPPELYREFHSRVSLEDECPVIVRTHEELAGWRGVHPQFSESEALERIETRYRRIQSAIPNTISCLASDGGFRQVAVKLKSDGWKEWHLLLAILAIRFNSLLNSGRTNLREAAERDLVNFRESGDMPLTPTGFFSETEMRRAISMSQLSTLRSMGFRMDQSTPNFSGVDSLLRRFKYWDLDIDHPVIFESQQQPVSV